MHLCPRIYVIYIYGHQTPKKKDKKYLLRWAREALASVMLTDQCPASHKLLPHSHHIASSQEVLQYPGMDRKALRHSLKLSKGHCCLYLRDLQKEIWPSTQNLNDIAD